MHTPPPRPHLRPERAADDAAVARLLKDALGDDGAGGALIARLRDDGDLLHVHVAETAEGAVAGVAVFSKAFIDGAAGGVATRAAVLGPVAVLAERQGRGLGGALARAGFAICRRRGVEAVLSTATGGFLDKLGFARAAAKGLEGPWKGAQLQALALHDDLAPLAGAVRFPPAFGRDGRGPRPGD